MEMNKISSEADISDKEEKLTDTLEKLKIVPLMPPVKTKNDEKKSSLIMNPFYFNIKKIKNIDDDDTNTKLFGPKCSKCSIGIRRNSVEHSIIKQTPFKHKQKNSNSCRIYLKESLLKTIHNSIYHDCNSTITKTNNTVLEYSGYPTLEDLKLEDDHSKLSSTIIVNKQPINNLKQKFIDLHVLIKSCDLISPPLSENSSLPRSLKNFTTLQSSDNRIIKNKKKIKNNIANVSNLYNNNSNNNYSISSSSSSSSIPSSSSSSCSQQARNGNNPSSSACDITIDELACYFETFVHIPKKMSSMAEMMYI